MRKAVYEVLDELNKTKKKDLPEALRAALVRFPALRNILYFGLSPNVTFDLPGGDPAFKRSDEINSHSLMWSEARRLYLFTTTKPLQPAKRQQLFIQTLEFVHPKDAELMLALKDGKWPYANVSKALVDEILPGLLDMKLTESGQRVS